MELGEATEFGEFGIGPTRRREDRHSVESGASCALGFARCDAGGTFECDGAVHSRAGAAAVRDLADRWRSIMNPLVSTPKGIGSVCHLRPCGVRVHEVSCACVCTQVARVSVCRYR